MPLDIKIMRRTSSAPKFPQCLLEVNPIPRCPHCSRSRCDHRCTRSLYNVPFPNLCYTWHTHPSSHTILPISHFLSLLMMLLILLWLLLKPVNLLCSSTALNLTLNLHSRGLVSLQLTRDISLFRRLWCRWRIELLDMAFGVVGLDGWRFVGFEFAEIEILDEIGCSCISPIVVLLRKV